jgi:hypothetical protein
MHFLTKANRSSSFRTTQSYTKRAIAIDESVNKSHDWKSPIFSIVNSGNQHPAHTGKVIGTGKIPQGAPGSGRQH